jgi:hypothetical protein
MMKKLVFFSIFAGLALSGCTSTPPQVQTRVVAVPSAKPYRYIKPHREDVLTEKTLSQIERHNNTHALVKKKEAEAAK